MLNTYIWQESNIVTSDIFGKPEPDIWLCFCSCGSHLSIFFLKENWYRQNTWSNRQTGPWSKNEAGQRLIEFYQENTLVITNTLFQQHKRSLYTWTSPDSQYRNQIDYIPCSQRWRSFIQSAKTTPGADCGTDHELLIAKFRVKLKKVGKTSRPFRYNLNQIPCDYTWQRQIDSRG